MRTQAVLRRTRARRRYGSPSRACSGEANLNGSWCSPPVSALLDGVGLFGIRLPPVRECLPELNMRTQAVLRRTRVRRRYASPSRACSGEVNPNGSWCSPPVRVLLDGVGLFGIRLPPVRECLPELSMRMQAVHRQTRARRRYGSPSRACSGEANLNGSWCSPPVSTLLDGVALFGIHLPPVRECLPELSMRTQAVLRRPRVRRRYGSPISRLLRRSKLLRELVLSSGERASRRSCALRYSSSSCEGMFAGAEHADAGCPPTNEGSSEVRTPHLVPAPAKQTLTEAGALLR